jgi:hypothetical protein
VAVLVLGGIAYFIVVWQDERKRLPPPAVILHGLVGGILDLGATPSLRSVGSVSVWLPTDRGDLQLWCAEYDKHPPFGGEQTRRPSPECALWGAFTGRKASIEKFMLHATAIAPATRFAVPLMDTQDRVKVVGVLCLEFTVDLSEKQLRSNGAWGYATHAAERIEPALTVLGYYQ